MEVSEQIFQLMPEPADDNLLAKALHLRGNIHRRLGKLELASKDLESALRSYEKSNDMLGIGNTTGDLGIVYYYQHEFEKAIDNYKRATAACEAQGNVLGVMIGHFNVGELLLHREEYEAAIPELQMAVDLARKKKIGDFELEAAFYLIDAQISLLHCDEAEAELSRIGPHIQKEASPHASGIEATVQARLLWKRNHPGQALDLFRRGLEFLDLAELKDDQSARAYMAGALFLLENRQSIEAKKALQKARNIYIESRNQPGLDTIKKIEDEIKQTST
jgi:tetratricopeptide (TPR) repeat protein